MQVVTQSNVTAVLNNLQGMCGQDDARSEHIVDVQSAISTATGCSCCKGTKLITVGFITVQDGDEPREKKLQVCPVCMQVHKDDSGTAVHGTLAGYFDGLLQKHGTFCISINANGHKLQLPTV